MATEGRSGRRELLVRLWGLDSMAKRKPMSRKQQSRVTKRLSRRLKDLRLENSKHVPYLSDAETEQGAVGSVDVSSELISVDGEKEVYPFKVGPGYREAKGGLTCYSLDDVENEDDELMTVVLSRADKDDDEVHFMEKENGNGNQKGKEIEQSFVLHQGKWYVAEAACLCKIKHPPHKGCKWNDIDWIKK